MTAYILKLIAIITMTIDHLGYVVYSGQLSWMNYIGRIAFPIFAFQISEGYTHTKNLKKYFLRLILFAVISQIPYTLFKYCTSSDVNLNIIFTLILGLLSISIYDFFAKRGETSKINSFSYKLIGIMISILISIFANTFKFDYGFYGVFLIFTFYLFRNNKHLRNIFVTILTFIYYLPSLLALDFNILVILLFLFTIIPLIFINMYNGQKGKNIKILFYIFYPVHLTILCLIALFIY